MQEISATGGGRSWSRAPGVTTNMNANRSASIPDAATNDAVVSGLVDFSAVPGPAEPEYSIIWPRTTSPFASQFLESTSQGPAQGGCERSGRNDRENPLMDVEVGHGLPSEKQRHNFFHFDRLKVTDEVLAYYVGTVLIFMAVLPQFINGVVMCMDELVVYFLGAFRVWGFLFSTFLAPVFVFALGKLFSITHDQLRKGAFILLVTTFVTLGGVFSVTTARATLMESSHIRDILWNRCDVGPTTSPLFYTYSFLHAVRLKEECAVKDSVVQCDGYVDSKEARILSRMESQLHCSGFCNALPTGNVLPTSNVSSQEQNSGLHPPALFSQERYQVQCESSMAFLLRDWVEDVSYVACMQGLLQIGLSSFILLVATFGERCSCCLLPFCASKT